MKINSGSLIQIGLYVFAFLLISVSLLTLYNLVQGKKCLEWSQNRITGRQNYRCLKWSD